MWTWTQPQQPQQHRGSGNENSHEVCDDPVEAGPLKVQGLALAANSLLACMDSECLEVSSGVTNRNS